MSCIQLILICLLVLGFLLICIGIVLKVWPHAINEYIKKYGNTKIAGFCDGIKNDIVPVRNAISMDASSGFVEGNNNKFKLIKRILFGRAGLGNLAKKCKLAFATKNPDFSLQDLL